MERLPTGLKLLQTPVLDPLRRLRGDLGNRHRRFVPANGRQRLSRRDGLQLQASVLVSERQRHNPKAATGNPHLLVEHLPICEEEVMLGNLQPALANEMRRPLARKLGPQNPPVRRHDQLRPQDRRPDPLRQLDLRVGLLQQHDRRVDQPRQRVLKRDPRRRQGPRPDPLRQLDLRVGPPQQPGRKTDRHRSTELRHRLVQSDRPKTPGSGKALAVNTNQRRPDSLVWPLFV